MNFMITTFQNSFIWHVRVIFCKLKTFMSSKAWWNEMEILILCTNHVSLVKLRQLTFYPLFVKNFDAVVGDTAIVSQRCEHAEFSQPYAESGLQMLIYIKPKRSERAWLFKKPFTTYLWVYTVIINVYNGFVVWLIERNHHPDFRGTKWNQIGTMLSLSFTTLFSQQGNYLLSSFLVCLNYLY